MRGRLPRGSLDSGVILAVAERLAGESGLAEVTIRKVAAALEVRHSAVHYHFRRRADLVDALLARAVRRFNDALPVIESDDWEEHVRGYWEAYRAVLRGDPALFELVVGQWATMGHSQEALDFSYVRIDAQLKVLLSAGFTAEQAGYAYHLLSTYTRGCLVSEHQFIRFLGPGRGGARPDGSTSRLPGNLDGFPSLRRVVASGWSYTFATDADFGNGLTVIIAGLRAWLGR
ncbi:MAG TPA: TetR/AcrR family transcriptional regulator C-terminal domain-containing protein [Amycolatopsis sp.]|nr:TetR/AcrR family transcriptional regulator C-terminal domain-containing protein [Amycolatopsis sp.]